MSDDPQLSERYRDLPREEPPRAIDEAILAASRRAVQRRRWYGPLAAAAVITLAVAVTLHVQHDRPSEEVDAVSPSMKVQEAPPPPPPVEAPKAERRAPQPFGPSPRSDSAAGALSGAPATVPAPAALPAPQAEQRARENAAAASASAGMRESRDEQRPQSPERAAQLEPFARSSPQPAPAAKPAPEPTGRSAARLMQQATTPERELERIAELRRLGRHEDADKALAEFRKAYPDYKIPGPMLERVEKK